MGHSKYGILLSRVILYDSYTSLRHLMGRDSTIAAMAGRCLALCITCLFLGITNDCSKTFLQLSFVERICFRGKLVGHRTNGILLSGTVYALVASHGSLKTSLL